MRRICSVPKRVQRGITAVVAGVVVLAPGRAWGQASESDKGADFFEKYVRPILTEHCLECHSGSNPKSDLSLTWRGGWVRGGQRGPALIPGSPDQSLLIRAVEGNHPDLKMPHQREALGESERRALREWVSMGAYDPRKSGNGSGSRGGGGRVYSDPLVVAGHWAFQGLERPALPVNEGAEWAQSPIDAFVLKGLRDGGIEASPRVDRRTWARRLYFDLLGVPPKPEELSQFVIDGSAGADIRLIDRLLEDPRYGERWGRYWLDVARYADTAGYRAVGQQRRFPYSHTYRDYVVDAFNRDLPFDRFVREQLAADLLVGDGASDESLAALGFLTIGRSFLDDPVLRVDDRIDVTTRGFLGLTVQCARCHDHKYDPIPIQDYYSLYGVFASVEEATPSLVSGRTPSPVLSAAYAAEKSRREREYAERFSAEVEKAQHRVREVAANYLLGFHESGGEKMGLRFLRERKLNPVVFRRLGELLKGIKPGPQPILGPWLRQVSGLAHPGGGAVNPEIARALGEYADLDMRELTARYNRVFAACDQVAPFADSAKEQVRRFLRDSDSPFTLPESEHWNLVQLVREPLNALKAAIVELDAVHPGAPLRAMAVTEREPLVRPAVFIRGNSRNRGEPVPRRMLALLDGDERKEFTANSGRLEVADSIVNPRNPLTARVLVNRIWSHHFGRPLVNSPNDFGVRADPPTHPELLDWMAVEFVESGWSIKSLHRLILRSATYAQSSRHRDQAAAIDPENRLLWRMNRRRLDLEAMRDTLLAVSGRIDLRQGGQAVDILAEPFSPRRSVYAFIDRANVSAFHRAFDLANPDVSTGGRAETSVPQQALFLMNNGFMRWLAEGVVSAREFVEKNLTAQRLEHLWQGIFQRSPSADERAEAYEFLRGHPSVPTYHGPVGWQYGVGEFDEVAGVVAGFSEFDVMTNGVRRFAEARDGAAALHDRGGHAASSTDHDVIRRWIAPAAGTIRLIGQLSHRSELGDGVTGFAVSGRQGVLGRWPVRNGARQATFEDVAVAAGERIDFICDCGANGEGDEFVWIPRVEYTALASGQISGGVKMIWGAKADFDRTFAPIPRRMSRWEQYAQALLQANELHFID